MRLGKVVTRIAVVFTSLMMVGLIVTTAFAADLGLTVQKIDSTQFPLVRAYVSVADLQGIPITGLDSHAFALTEDGKAIDAFKVEPVVDSQVPVAVVMAFDVSGSMNDQGKLTAAKQAASAFVDAMGPNDTAAIIAFSDQVKILQGYTSDKTALKNAIGQLKAQGNTAIYDAIAQASILQGAVPEQRKIILLLTDGDDNASKTTLDGAIGDAKNVRVPIFAIGLGTDVKKAALDKLASSTSGQAIYVTVPDQLRQIFLSIGDQLRREYILSYTSKLPADNKQHTLGITVNYVSRTATTQASFDAKGTPLGVDVTGLTDAAKVSGTVPVTVTITGGVAQEAQLLVDNQLRATANTAPFVLNWDTSKESPGIHRVVVQVKAASGQPTEKQFVVEVANVVATAVPTAAPTEAPTAVPPTPAPTAAPAPPASSGPSPLVAAAAAVGVLAVIGIVVGIVMFSSRRPSAPPPPPAPVPAPPPPPVRTDRTVVMDRTEVIAPVDTGATLVAGAMNQPPPPPPPRGTLHIVQLGTESDVPLSQPETILGRETSNPIVLKDPMASRRHARIVLENGDYWIEDLKSLNGTRVNGEVLGARWKLSPNDQIKIGDVVLTFSLDGGKGR
ncbi:MAG TPA: VWA domain-containing protein [Chloroflexota bacterium]|nr:VWA domain-containing protein [Chloroflexota bacterium]